MQGIARVYEQETGEHAMFEDWNGIIAGIVLFIGVALGLRSIRQVRQVQRDRVRRARDELRQRGT